MYESYGSKEEENTDYICPNCGMHSKLKDFIDRCPYCKAYYNIDYENKDLGSKYHYDGVLGNMTYNGSEIALYYIDRNMAMEESDERYKEKTIWIGQIEEYTAKERLFTGAFSNMPVYYQNEKDYLIYLVEGNCDDSGYWNPGFFLFTAFNEKKEIVYKAEE